MRIEITRMNPGEPMLKRRRWIFYVSVGAGDKVIKVRLDLYCEEERRSVRNRIWSPIEHFASRRSGHFIGAYSFSTSLTREQVPIPPDVYDEIHAILLLNTRIF